MRITGDRARSAGLVLYHQITKEDTVSDLDDWADYLLDGTKPQQPPPDENQGWTAPDEWFLDNGDGTFSLWNPDLGHEWDLMPSGGVGDFLVFGVGGYEFLFFSPAAFARQCIPEPSRNFGSVSMAVTA